MKSDPLNTAHFLGDLGRRTTSSALITTVAQAVKFAINLASTLILARLLDPQDFGLVAMVTAATGFLEVLKDAGLSTATVQRKDITQAQVSNLFWANLVLGLLIMTLVASLSPALSLFYNEPRLTAVAMAVSVTFLLTASTVQHQAILRRQMRFTAISVIQIVPALVGLGVAIAMASNGWGYWSLVGTTLAAAGCNCVITLLLSDWRPGLPTRGVGTWALLQFGASLTGAAVVQTLISTADTLLIGRFYGANAVGLYSRGAALLLNPLQQFLSPFNAVLVPALSRMQGDPARYRSAFLKTLNFISLVALPIAGFLLASAEPLVLVLLGEKWRDTIPIFSAFSIAAIYLPLAGATTWLFTSQGRGRETLTTCIITAAISLLSVISGLPFGPAGVALAFSLTGLSLRMPILFYYAGRNGPVHTRDLWSCLLTHLPLGILTFAITFCLHWFWPLQSPTAQLCVSFPCCALGVGFFLFCSPFHRHIASEALNRFRTSLPHRRAANGPP